MKMIHLHFTALHIWRGCCVCVCVCVSVYSIDLFIMLWIYIRPSLWARTYLHSPALASSSHLSHISIISRYTADIQGLDSKTAGTPRLTESHRMWIQNNAPRLLWCMDVHNYTSQDLSLSCAPLFGNCPSFWQSCLSFSRLPPHVVCMRDNGQICASGTKSLKNNNKAADITYIILIVIKHNKKTQIENVFKPWCLFFLCAVCSSATQQNFVSLVHIITFLENKKIQLRCCSNNKLQSVTSRFVQTPSSKL